jgi:rubrerythrin
LQEGFNATEKSYNVFEINGIKENNRISGTKAKDLDAKSVELVGRADETSINNSQPAMRDSIEEAVDAPAIDYESWVVKCDKKHPMIYTDHPYGNEKFLCQNCTIDFSPTNYCFHCPECQYDLCMTCSALEHLREKSPSESSPLKNIH